MTALLYPFLGLSVLGLALSLMVHVGTWLGVELPFEVFGLHFGVFVVWTPTAFISNFTRHGFRRRYGWREALRGCPRWMRWMAYGLFAYAFVNFFLSIVVGGMVSGGVSPLRAFSGHWMMFYGLAFATLYSTLHLQRADHEQLHR